jgi:hypothetical protein
MSGNWRPMSLFREGGISFRLWFVPESSPQYVHADNHEFQFDSQNSMYIGNDGGIGISTESWSNLHCCKPWI